MHGEAADKPRYSFNFRVGLGGKKRKRRNGGEGGKKNGRGGLMKRANVAPGEEAGGGERSF